MCTTIDDKRREDEAATRPNSKEAETIDHSESPSKKNSSTRASERRFDVAIEEAYSVVELDGIDVFERKRDVAEVGSLERRKFARNDQFA